MNWRKLFRNEPIRILKDERLDRPIYVFAGDAIEATATDDVTGESVSVKAEITQAFKCNRIVLYENPGFLGSKYCVSGSFMEMPE